MLRPWVANSSVTTAITGRSRCSIATASAIANDVHEPQVPSPTIAKSTARASVADVAAVGGAGVAHLAVGLDRGDRGRAVGPEALLPVGGEQPPRSPGGVGADAGPQAGHRSVEAERRAPRPRRRAGPSGGGSARCSSPHPRDLCARIQLARPNCDRAGHHRPSGGSESDRQGWDAGNVWPGGARGV